MKQNLPKRKPTRLKDFNYNNERVYFVTVCTKNKLPVLSKITAPDSEIYDSEESRSVYHDDEYYMPKTALFEYGRIADKYLKQLDGFYSEISVLNYVIMPEHIHLLLFVSPSDEHSEQQNRQNSILSGFVSTFKRFCGKEIGENIWQDSFFEHIIRNEKDYDEHIRYIINNPLKRYYKNSDTHAGD